MQQIRTINRLILLSVFAILTCFFVSSGFAAGEDVTVLGDTKGQSLSLENAALPALGSGREIRYDNAIGRLYVWGGAEWEVLSSDKNVATKTVAIDRYSDRIIDDGDTDLTNRTADYICDGLDDQVEIQQAIDSLVDENGLVIPGVVYLLEGTYVTSAPIDFDDGSVATGDDGINDSGKALIGTGTGTVLSGTTEIISASSVDRILISQLMITNGGGFGMHFKAVTSSKINKVWVNGTIADCMRLEDVTNSIISNSTLEVFNTHGIHFKNSSHNIVTNNNVQGDQGGGIFLDKSSNSIISNNYVQPKEFGIKAGGSLSNNNTISNNNIQGSDQYGIELASSADNTTITGNNIQDNGLVGTIYDGIIINSNNNLISGNNIRGSADNGIELSSGSVDNLISGNMIIDNGSNGIDILSASDRNIIFSNHISKPSDTTNSGYGINIGNSDCNDNYLVANYIDDNNGQAFTAEINDLGTDTQYTSKEKISLDRTIDGDSGDGLQTNTSYVRIGFNGAFDVEDGKAAGDILIIEGPLSGSGLAGQPKPDNIKLCNAHPNNHQLDPNDTLTLIWSFSDDEDDTNDFWLELSYTDN